MLKKILSKFFTKKEKEDTEHQDESEFLIKEENIGASITITLNAQTADFNVIVDISEMSDECSFTLGSLLGMLNNGELSTYFTQAYQSWCSEDYDKQAFIGKVLYHWLDANNSFSSEYDNVAVKPSQVFNFPMKE